MLKDVTLATYALTDVETAFDYLRLHEVIEDTPHVTRAINHATAQIERYTERALKSRAHTFILDGDGTRVIILPEWPITTLTSADYIDTTTNTYYPIVTTGAVSDDGGIVTLANDAFGMGTRNIRVIATCGYLAGTHDSQLQDLERACLRLTQVFYQDWKNQVGRAVNAGIAGESASLSQSSMPEDVALSLLQYRRIY